MTWIYGTRIIMPISQGWSENKIVKLEKYSVVISTLSFKIFCLAFVRIKNQTFNTAIKCRDFYRLESNCTLNSIIKFIFTLYLRNCHAAFAKNQFNNNSTNRRRPRLVFLGRI